MIRELDILMLIQRCLETPDITRWEMLSALVSLLPNRPLAYGTLEFAVTERLEDVAKRVMGDLLRSQA